MTLLSHWRRHPASFATLFIGLAVATALWSGVQALNQQARSSYDRAAAVISGGGLRSIVGAQGGPISEAQYVTLRRDGWKVSPVVEGTARVGDVALRLLGVEPLTLPRTSPLATMEGVREFKAFMTPPWRALIAPETLAELKASEGDRPLTDRARQLPPLQANPDVPPGLVLIDIAAAQDILDRRGRVTRLMLAPKTEAPVDDLKAVAGEELRLVEPEEMQDLERLTESFHMNLTAFGLLAFFVGLFIVHASMGLAFEQRLPAVRTMRAVGVSQHVIMGAMLAEVVVLALAAGTAGMICGYAIAAGLLPDVTASLEGLYGAHVAGRLAVEPAWWISGLAMTLLGAIAAAAVGLVKTYRMPVLAIAQPLAWRQAHERHLAQQGALAAAALAVALLTYLLGTGLLAGFIVIAGVLVGAALLLPLALAALLVAGESRARSALSQWFFADSRQQLSGLSLALMALLLALAANVGVGTMVDGFRKTFTGWLDERLVSEVYFDATGDAEADRIAGWLERRSDVTAVLPFWKAETRLAAWPVDVFGFRDHATYREHFPLIAAASDVWDRVHAGRAVLVSEQLARRTRLAVGSPVDIPTSIGIWGAEVAGIYPDYGNPKGQLRIDLDALLSHWPDVRRTSYSLRVAPDQAAALIRSMQAEFGAAIGRIIDQSSLKAISTRIFEKTFAVTAALNSLTLIVSGIALVASLLTLGNQRLAQMAPVWAVGVTRRRLATLELAKILLLAAATACLAIPLGLALAWCLVAIVNVEAFGWRLPLHVFPAQWLEVMGLAILTSLVASIAPLVRLGRTSAADLLKVFANER
jgi:putative ABC transport system permease protein